MAYSSLKKSSIRKRPLQNNEDKNKSSGVSNEDSHFSSRSPTDQDRKPFKKYWKWLAALVIAIIIVWLLPCPIAPIRYDLPAYVEPPMNAELRKSKRLFEGEIVGPEAFVVDKNGNQYTGLRDGRVIRFTDNKVETVVRMGSPPYDNCGSQTVESESHCGRPLGLAIDSSSAPYHIYIADSYHGIQLLDTRTRKLTTLLNTTKPHDGVPPMKLVNSLVLLSNTSIFFTDSSSKFAVAEVLLDCAEGSGNGKLMHYVPSTGELNIILPGLYFPNGICVSPTENYLLIAETMRARIIRYYLSGPKEGTWDVFANLPGLPDNISPSSSGGYWVGLAASRRSGVIDMLATRPWLRTLLAKFRLFDILFQFAPQHGMVVRLSSEGEIEETLWDEGAKVISEVSSVLDVGDKLYFGSYKAPYLASLELT